MTQRIYLKPDWPAPTQVQAITTTRQGGYSKAPYDSYNLAPHVGDDPQAVLKNRQQLREDLALPCEPCWLQQVHGVQAVNAALENETPEADAAYARKPGAVCAIMAADCLPILVCNQKGNEVAAIHAGWQGLLAGVVNSTIRKLHSNPAELMAWLGPALGPEKFEVNNKIRLDFIQHNPENGAAFKQNQREQWFVDLYEMARNDLYRCGITKIFGGDFCTYQDTSRFYSYRRDQKITGRMATLIWLNP